MTQQMLEELNNYQLRQIAEGCFVGCTPKDRRHAAQILAKRTGEPVLVHGDCCEHPRWRHRFAASSRNWRYAMVAWLISKGILLAYLLHPVVHTIARAFGIGCP